MMGTSPTKTTTSEQIPYPVQDLQPKYILPSISWYSINSIHTQPWIHPRLNLSRKSNGQTRVPPANQNRKQHHHLPSNSIIPILVCPRDLYSSIGKHALIRHFKTSTFGLISDSTAKHDADEFKGVDVCVVGDGELDLVGSDVFDASKVICSTKSVSRCVISGCERFTADESSVAHDVCYGHFNVLFVNWFGYWCVWTMRKARTARRIYRQEPWA
jgi:hypothetical protein